MDINALITHQFNEVISNPKYDAKNRPNGFATACQLVKKLSESLTTETLHTRVGTVIRSMLILRDMCAEDGADPSLVENLIRQRFAEKGTVLDVLAESAHPPVPVPAGVYVIRGRQVELEQDLLPIDECLGNSVYRTPETGYFVFSEAKRRGVEEDAPVNAVGTGNIAGVSPGQEPPGPKGGFKALMRLRRKKKSPQIPPMDGRPK